MLHNLHFDLKSPDLPNVYPGLSHKVRVYRLNLQTIIHREVISAEQVNEELGFLMHLTARL